MSYAKQYLLHEAVTYVHKGWGSPLEIAIFSCNRAVSPTPQDFSPESQEKFSPNFFIISPGRASATKTTTTTGGQNRANLRPNEIKSKYEPFQQFE